MTEEQADILLDRIDLIANKVDSIFDLVDNIASIFTDLIINDPESLLFIVGIICALAFIAGIRSAQV